MALYSKKRMLVGPGISIPSQLRWLSYVEQWRDSRNYFNIPFRISHIQLYEVKDIKFDVGIAVFRKNFNTETWDIFILHLFKENEVTKSTENGKITITYESKSPILCQTEFCLFLARNRLAGNSSFLRNSMAQCWINTYFEPLKYKKLGWNEMDCIGGINKKKSSVFESIKINWNFPADFKSKYLNSISISHS